MGIEDKGDVATAGTKYIPAARWRVFTRIYDPVIALTMRERRWRGSMEERVMADLPDGGVAVDVGCGTGTFAIALAASRPDAKLIGVDGDAEILDRARRKPGAAGVEWRQGLAQELPVADGGADVLTTSLVLHHLLPEDKGAALEEAARVLKPGGRLHVADWGEPQDPLIGAAFLVSQAIDGFDRTRDHRDGRLRTAFGALDLWGARNVAGDGSA